MSRSRRPPTHENATIDPTPSKFAIDLHERALRPDDRGIVERIPPVKGVRPRRVYFTDATGIRWRVFDTSYGPPEGAPYEEKHFAPPYPPAKARTFVAADGSQRSFSFSDRHAPEEIKRPLITPAILAAQLRLADYPQDTAEEDADPRRNFAIAPLSTWKPTEHHNLRNRISTLNRWTAFDAD